MRERLQQTIIYSITNQSINGLICSIRGARTLKVENKKTCPPSTDIIFYKIRSIHVCNVDKNGGKISEFRFLKKVLKMDVPKVYFFGSLRKSLSPINENPKIAAIFHKTNWNVLICSTCRRYMPRCFAPRRAEGPTVTRAEGPFSHNHTTQKHIICLFVVILCSRS